MLLEVLKIDQDIVKMNVQTCSQFQDGGQESQMGGLLMYCRVEYTTRADVHINFCIQETISGYDLYQWLFYKIIFTTYKSLNWNWTKIHQRLVGSQYLRPSTS